MNTRNGKGMNEKKEIILNYVLAFVFTISGFILLRIFEEITYIVFSGLLFLIICLTIVFISGIFSAQITRLAITKEIFKSVMFGFSILYGTALVLYIGIVYLFSSYNNIISQTNDPLQNLNLLDQAFLLLVIYLLFPIIYFASFIWLVIHAIATNIFSQKG